MWLKIYELVCKRSSDGASKALVLKRYKTLSNAEDVRKVANVDATNADKEQLESLISTIKAWEIYAYSTNLSFFITGTC